MGKRRLTRAEAQARPRSRSQRTFWIVAASVLVVVGGIVAYFTFWGGTGMAREGQRAPDFTLKLLNGDSVRLSSLRGQAVLVNFWHST